MVCERCGKFLDNKRDPWGVYYECLDCNIGYFEVAGCE